MTREIERKEYMDGKATHREYYAQFVTDTTKAQVVNHFGVEKLVRHSDDPHLNGIPLHFWDMLYTMPETVAQMRRVGEAYAPSTCVCIFKEAARQIIDQANMASDAAENDDE